jgi:uncharacterized protein YabN with tetrapyrrole methylase and pyrophosphatase domain
MREKAFHRLIQIMATLRSPEGCPWDREQTPESLIPYLAEEACEVIEALAGDDTDAICEELGDLLLQVVFLARVFEERGAFSIEDVVTSINQKLERRHPHVFGDHPTIHCPAEQSILWDKIKQQEKLNKPSATTAEAPRRSKKAPLTPALTLALGVLQHGQQLPPPPSPSSLMKYLEEIIAATTKTDCHQAIDWMILSLVALRNTALSAAHDEPAII